MRKNFKYIVKPEDGVVVAIMPTHLNYDILHAFPYTDGDGHDYLHDCIDDAMSCLHITDYSECVRGIARCNEKDEFNEETGKQIASLKAQIKYNRKLYKKFTKLSEFFNQMAQKCIFLAMERLNINESLMKEIKVYYNEENKSEE